MEGLRQIACMFSLGRRRVHFSMPTEILALVSQILLTGCTLLEVNLKRPCALRCPPWRGNSTQGVYDGSQHQDCQGFSIASQSLTATTK